MADSINDLFELSLNAENEAMVFYTTLAKAFTHNIDASDFFKTMASDEAIHISNINSLQTSLTEDELSANVPESAMQMTREFLKFSAKDALSKTGTLDQAYKFTVNLEYSEMNKLHELLIELFMPIEKKKETYLKMLNSHMDKLKKFTSIFSDTETRTSVKPKGL